MIKFSDSDVILVTGASSGIGRSVALLLNELGATVVGIARNENRLQETKQSAKNPDKFFCEIKDLSKDISDLPNYVKSLKDKYGKFYGLAYCAGIVDLVPLRILEAQKMKYLFDINYFAPIFMLKGFADKRVNIGNGASCVFISSASSILCDKAMTAYAGSKAALISSAKSAARELAKQGIRVNTVSPTDIDTHMIDPSMSLRDENRLNMYPFGFGEPIDVASIVAFLLSSNAKWITAQNYIVDCGYF